MCFVSSLLKKHSVFYFYLFLFFYVVSLVGFCNDPSRQVSISGLFDMSAMMKHIAEQYAYPYGFANTKVKKHHRLPRPSTSLPCLTTPLTKKKKTPMAAVAVAAACLQIRISVCPNELFRFVVP